ncbi:MAG: two-component system cell cycle response regulator DivK [Gammaproteobacteria bacterium]|jgi:two-component system cell cycle response regulator DivK
MSGALILVVEDNERSAKLLHDVLEHRGYRVLVATNGEDGVALAREHLPALVLMDIQLPGINGIEAFEQLQVSTATRDIPVIAVTASAMHEEVTRIASVGFAGYQPKPIRVMEFLQAMEAILESAAPRADKS